MSHSKRLSIQKFGILEIIIPIKRIILNNLPITAGIKNLKQFARFPDIFPLQVLHRSFNLLNQIFQTLCCQFTTPNIIFRYSSNKPLLPLKINPDTFQTFCMTCYGFTYRLWRFICDIFPPIPIKYDIIS